MQEVSKDKAKQNEKKAKKGNNNYFCIANSQIRCSRQYINNQFTCSNS